jgi:hypothetical protein
VGTRMPLGTRTLSGGYSSLPHNGERRLSTDWGRPRIEDTDVLLPATEPQQLYDFCTCIRSFVLS